MPLKLLIVLRCMAFSGIIFLINAPRPAHAQTTPDPSDLNITAIVTFLAFVFLTLVITWFAAKRIKDRKSFYVAGGGISAWQNGMAIAGDFMSAATLLGITGLMYLHGYDPYILSLGVVVSWPIMMMLIAERFRNLGRFTLVDVITYRLQDRSVRILSAIASLFVVIFYLIGQMVGAGKLIELLFGIDYLFAVSLVTALMMCYVIFGGMIATTWVQIIKAGLLLSGGILIVILMLAQFDFDFSAMLAKSAEISPHKGAYLQPGLWLKNDLFQAITVGLTMCFGIMGLPHILMRFFTVKDASAARNSVSIAAVIMAIFYIVILILGFGAVAIIWGDPRFIDESGTVVGNSNMIALHVAQAVGGNILLGYMSAVTFATILAVVAGLTLAGSAAISHDLYSIFRPKAPKEGSGSLLTTRIAAGGIGIIALILGVLFETQNIAVVTAIALAIAASINFPILILSMYWQGTTSKGYVYGGSITLAVCFVLIVLSDSVWVKILGFETALFPYIYPTFITLPLGFISIILFSILDKSATAKKEKAAFAAQYFRAETGYGVEETASH